MPYPDHREIQTALTGVVMNANLGLPVVYPNQDDAGTVRKAGEMILFLQVNFTARRSGLSSDMVVGVGQLIASVIDDRGVGAGRSADAAQLVSDLFDDGAEVPLSVGSVVFDEPPVIQTAYEDGADWRVPMVASFLVLT